MFLAPPSVFPPTPLVLLWKYYIRFIKNKRDKSVHPSWKVLF